MNQLNDLLTELRNLEVKLWLDGGKVQVSAPKGAMTPNLREQMMRHREDIRTFLAQQSTEQTIRPADRNGHAPLSYAQQQLWFLMSLDGESAAYNVPTALRLRGALDVPSLEESMRQILARHEILRTTFPLIDGGTVQQIEEEPTNYAIEQVDLTHLSHDEQERFVYQIIDSEANSAFNLEAGPLTVSKLFRFSPDEHVLFVNQHHIVIDGWSTGILIHELSTLYQALVGGTVADLPPLSIQYADYAIWQNEWLQGQSYQERLAYWADHMAGAPGLLELPTDHVRPAVQSTRGNAITAEIPAELAAQIQTFSREQGLSIQMTMMAAYLVLLSRYSSTTDLVVGVPVANRNLPELEPLIGFFVNTLPVRFRLEPEISFAQLLARVKETMLAAYARQDVPFDQIVEKVQPERSLSYAPLFQVVFNFLSMATEDLELPGLSIEMLGTEMRTAKHDLTLDVNVMAEQIGLSWQFSTDLFEAETIERINRHFQEILRHGLGDPTWTVANIPLLTATERTQMLTAWNATAAEFPLHLPVHKLISRHAQITPDETALIFTDSQGLDYSLTFADYNQRANQLAHYLQAQGVSVGTMVGICANRSLDVMVGILAIMKSGGVYVPLDPEYPQERLQQSIEDSGMALLLTQHELAPKLAWVDVPHFYLDQDWYQVIDQPRTDPFTTAAPADGLYLIFTSGSTGRPKGVLAAHRGVANLALALGQEIGVVSGDRMLQFASFSFDASALQMFVPLINGGTLVLHHDPTKLSAQELMDFCARQKMTIVDLPAALWRQWVVDMKNQTLKLPSSVRFFLTGGEAVPAETLRQWAYLSPREVEFLSSYGPTEASITTTIFRSSNNELIDVTEQDLTIGRPLPNTSIYILDEYRNPVPIGVYGEIFIGGVGITLGYHQDEELTAAKFINNPFGEGKIYRTGDWGRYRANGDIEFIGRVDNQVKIRGFRIELGEIEAVLGQHPLVQEIIVLAPADENGRKMLVAYLVPTAAITNEDIDRTELRNFVAAHLPKHMVPAAFVQLRSMPTLPNGKVDRKALPAPSAESLIRANEYAAPTTATEEKLAEIWQALLGVESVGLHDNFFELGGDSIMGMQVVGRAREAGIHLTARDLFEHQTIAELAQAATAESTAITEQGLVTGAVPLTPIQRWFFALNTPEPHHFNQSTMLTLPSTVTVAQVERIVGQLLEHHDALRAVFTLTDEGWTQEFTDVPEAVPVEMVDFSHMADAAAQRAAIETAANACQRSFDLKRGPLVKALFMRLGADKPSRLLLVMHHLVIDGVSWRIILEDLQALFAQMHAGQPTLALPQKSTSYRQWAEWLSTDAIEIVAPQRAYWQTVVAQPLQPLPRTAKSGVLTGEESPSTRSVESTLDAQTTAALLTAAHAPYRTQVNDLLLSALAVAITRWSGDDQLMLALEGHGRTDISESVDLSRTVGWFTNQFPLRLTVEEAVNSPQPNNNNEGSDFVGTTDIGMLLRSVKEQLRSVPDSGVGYSILRYMDGDAALNNHPAPEILFNYLGQADAGLSQSDETDLGLNSESESGKNPANGWDIATEGMGEQISPKTGLIYPLEINGSVMNGSLSFEWSYDANHFDEDQITKAAADFTQCLHDIVAHCAEAKPWATPSDYPLATITQDELDQVLQAYPQAETIYDGTPAQAGMLFHSQLAPGSGVYILQSEMTLAADLDQKRLRAAFDQLIQRHTLLRTAFVSLERTIPLQVVLPGRSSADLEDGNSSVTAICTTPWTELDWRDERDFENRYAALVTQDQQTDFQPTQAPLMRVTLIHAPDGKYRLLWTMHHVITDGWSSAILFGELLQLYGANGMDAGAISLPPAVPFDRYIAWLQKQHPNAAADFWRKTLEGFVTPTTLLGDAPKSHDAIRDESHAIELAGITFQQLDAATRCERITMSTLIQGAWSILLSRYTQQEDVAVGITVSGRPADLVGAEEMVGMFLNILPLRVQVDEGAAVWEWLRSIQSHYAEADRFSYMPLADIQKLSELSASQGLFESLIIFQNYPVGEEVVDAVDADGALLEDFDAHEQTNFPITLFVSTVNQTDGAESAPDGFLGIDIHYDANRFDAETITRLGEQLKTILTHLATIQADGPLHTDGTRTSVNETSVNETTVGQIDFLSPAERHQLLNEWNQTTQAYPHQETLVSLFDAIVQDAPHAVALIDDAQEISYAMLNRSANQIATRLASMGVTRETLVGICVERSAQMVAALLGILKAGGAYIPLDPSYPTERLNYMLVDSGAGVLITHRGYESRFEAAVKIVDLDALDGLNLHSTECDAAAIEPFKPEHEIQPDDLAYVIYTSGSTGQPKGVQALHRGAMNRLHWMWAEMPFGIDEVAAQKTALSFVDSVWEIFGPLLQGVPSVIIANEVLKDPAHFIETLAEQYVTRLVLVPSLLQAMLDTDDQLAERLPCLKEWICSGETLTGHLVDRFRQAMPHARMINLYGSSEVAGDVTWFDTSSLVEDYRFGSQNVPIGHPIANTQIYILDKQMHPVPLGAVGEIYVGGENVARGYHNQPALTAERFVENPFGPGQLYYMADWGRYRPDGTIEFLGRRDSQIKIRGFRVELGEVEATLLQHPAIREAVVVAHSPSASTGTSYQQLVAYIVPQAGDPTGEEVDGGEQSTALNHIGDPKETFDASRLRTDLMATLPDYMVPALCVPLESMPLLPNGKVNRHALPTPDSDAFTTSSSYVPPTTPLEAQLVEMWSQVLGLETDRIGIHHNFFELGGHSLIATQIISRIRNEFGADIALRTLFEEPTVAGLAQQLQQAEQAAALPPLTRADRTQTLPLSFAQERLWFLMMYDSSSIAYNMPNALRLTGAFDPSALEASVGLLLERHESLRTTFPLVDGDPVQQINPAPYHYGLPLLDLSGLNDSAREDEAQRVVQEEAVRPFDLEQGPLFHILLIKLAHDDHILFLNLHHIITDGWSNDILIHELITLYESYVAGNAIVLPPLTVQYADYTQWQRAWLNEELLEEQLDYWQKQLADAPALLELTGDRPRPLVPTFESQTLTYHIEPALVRQLEAVGRQHGATLFMTLLAAFGVLLHRYSRQDEVMIGSPIANRNHPDLEGLIGFFVNTLALRIDMRDEPTFAELLRRVHEMTMSAYANQDAPFAQVVERLPLDRTVTYNPVYQVMFALQNTPTMPTAKMTSADLQSNGRAADGAPTEPLQVAPVDAERGSNHHDLMLLLSEEEDGESGGGLSGTLEFNLDIFDEATVQRLLNNFTQLLQSIVSQPNKQIGALPLLGNDERHLLIEAWNANDKPYPAEKHVAQLFEEEANRRPENVALIFGDRQISYGELDAQSNQLARYILSRDVAPGARIGLCVERSIEMVVASLAILKAGCAYVPLDPSYPEERLHFMIQDTAMSLIFVQDHLRASLGDYDGPLFNLDTDLPQLADYSSDSLSVEQRPTLTAQSLAYIMYTSGSTGQPKGAAIPHQAIVRLVKETNYMEMGPDQVFLQLAPTAFDAATLEIWGPLLNGGRLVIMPPGQPTMAEIAQALVKHEITALFITTALFNMMVDEHLDAIVRVLQVLTGGEIATVEKINRFIAAMPEGHRLVHVYGPTENTTFTTGYPIFDSASRFESSVPIGRPISHTTTFVLDKMMQPVPIGVPGELYTGGDGVALGYWNRPELTAERFVDNPFGVGKLYRTGDLVRYLPDGNIDFIGRIDAQVKIRGHRIELGEIEHHLGLHPDVQQVVVLAREDVPGEKVLVAYIVLEAGSAWNPAGYREALSDALPAYMVPNVYIQIEAIPITPNGKTDQRSLPVPEASTIVANTDYAPPANYLEEKLVALWGELFEMEPELIGVHHSFFELGGHSLVAAKNVTQIQEQFGVTVSLRRFFESPTLAEIGDVIYDDLLDGLSEEEFEAILAEVDEEMRQSA